MKNKTSEKPGKNPAPPPVAIRIGDVERVVTTVRGQRVILDAHVAALYGVKTMHVNQAVRNNPDKFPDGYILSLSPQEKQEVVKIFDHLLQAEVIKIFDNLASIKFSPHPPKAFTEKGLYMLATVLKSAVATRTTLAIVEAFAKLRDLARTVAELSTTSDRFAQKSLMERGGEILADVLGEGLEKTEQETTLELNLAVLKFKHTVRRKPH
jgi:hypothetical protein